MSKGDFLWCDLSTFRLPATRAFYARLFGWDYGTQMQPDGSPYHIAATGLGPCAGLFEMPEKFQRIGLPSFWMSYIEVDDIGETVERAREMGGKVEMEPTAFGGGASIALIRDPLGAGFTVLQGGGFAPRVAERQPGHMVWNALYVSDARKVMDFYAALFDWRLVSDPASPGTLWVRNAQGQEVSAVHELADEIRGRFQFWGVHFAVSDLAAARARVLEGGGRILYEGPSMGEASLLAQDPDGAAFFLTATGAHPERSERSSPALSGGFRWKTLLGLLIIWMAVVFEVNWVWGVLFLMWTIPAIRSGHTFFVEPIQKTRNGVLFWMIVGTWIGLSLYLIAVDLWAAAGYAV